ncbi:MAG: hypothetical protein KF856_01015 [Cyclobacteriaceae bacterium]|nr:hypothetical protein [Cyclobacteriaceae bacterium]
MRPVYFLVGIFAVWCVSASFWFLFWVKGLDPKPENINPHQSALAIAEILLIVLVSLLIGFGIGWYLNQLKVSASKNETTILKILLTEKEELIQQATDRAHKTETTLTRARETFRSDFLTISRENERLKTVEEAYKSEQELWQHQTSELQSTINDLQKGFNDAKQEVLKCRQEKQKLEIELSELLHVQRSKKGTVPANVESATQPETDDLKMINGIGPGIEAKLNKAGIYSFRQLSELTEESIQRVASVIEFFPGRIARDRWVEQASKLYLDKLRK